MRRTTHRARWRHLRRGWALACAALTVLVIPAVSYGKDKGGGRKKRSDGIAAAITYRGLCDASAAAPLDGDHVLVASDEDSRIRLFDNHHGGLPLRTFNLTDRLRLEWGSNETDIEGAARVGDRVYWITSHSRNSEGKFRPNRCRFFATGILEREGERDMDIVGAPYTRLLDDLASAPELRRFQLGLAALRPPKAAGGLNIEGLCAMPDGALLIGFRNPVPEGRALLVPLTNPAAVVEGRAARFGEPILVDLDGLAIRDMAFHDGRYVIVAGSHDGRGAARLYDWSGPGAAPRPISSVRLKGLNPEAVVLYPDAAGAEFQLFSDDSGSEVRGKKCPDVKEEDRRFRSVWIDLE